MRGHFLGIFSLSWLAVGSAVSALTYVHVPDESLARQAEVIARVEVVDSTVDSGGNRVSTRYTVWVDEVVKGSLADSHLTVRVPGGLAPAMGLELRYDGAPRFVARERALLFLRRNDDGTYRVLHFALGAFWERRVGAATVLVRDLPEPVGATKSIHLGREAERFVDWLRDEVAGRHRQADYLVQLSQRDAAPPSEKFTVFSPLQSWGEFRDHASAQRVDWQRHKKGQTGVPSKGKKQLKQVFKVLNSTEDSTSRKGGQASRSGLTNLALRGKFRNPPDLANFCFQENFIVFADAAEVIQDDFNCSDGGVLAVGGSCRTVQPVDQWKGRDVHDSVSGRLIFNKGSECYYRGDAPFNFDTPSNKFAEVAMHEILHALGLLHACGDDDSPKCSASAVLDDATMRAQAHADGRGAALREDDLSGFWFLYDSQFLAAPCHLPPGHKNFCKRCGPCGDGQGRCQKDKQCFDGLQCQTDAEQGFKTCQ